jgi:hypothetical protein
LVDDAIAGSDTDDARSPAAADDPLPGEGQPTDTGAGGRGGDYQASYLITQAVNELCPALIWQLRNSATNYRPPES